MRYLTHPCLSATCLSQGKEFLHGEVFAKSDGCNNCTCNDGNITCTKDVCFSRELLENPSVVAI